MSIKQKPEILAPAGTLETVRTVIEAGADAVYLGGKTLNMRQHRGSYNLDEAELAEAVKLAHEQGKKIYYTLNSLLLDEDLGLACSTLEFLGQLGPDALIVQDLAVAALAREICVQLPLHASTMMNIHSVQSALALRMMGFSRVISSRDISLAEVRRIGQASGLEMEYFVHGDLCVAQSGQCHISGILFGKSSNCGLCTKPCRWDWKLVTDNPKSDNGQIIQRGYLLARKDMCLFDHIPELVENGIVSLKIEGRMRTAEFLRGVVAAYRQAVDEYCADPAHYTPNPQTRDDLWAKRVREFTTCRALGDSGADSIDISGKREPRFFSLQAPPVPLKPKPSHTTSQTSDDLELVVHVGDVESAQKAVEAGANAIYLDSDNFTRKDSGLNIHWLKDFTDQAAEERIRVAVLDARIFEEDDLIEWRSQLEQLAEIEDLWVGASTLESLKVAQETGIENILADFSFNVTNSVTADELSTMGAKRITASIELNLVEIQALTENTRMPVEVIGQGPLPGMLLEDCLVAMAKGIADPRTCPADCQRKLFAIEDLSGQRFRLAFDSKCRTHLYCPADTCALFSLSALSASGTKAVRIEAQLDTAEVVSEVVGVYRQALDTTRAGCSFDFQQAIKRIRSATGRPLGDRPFGHVRSGRNRKEVSTIETAVSRS